MSTSSDPGTFRAACFGLALLAAAGCNSPTEGVLDTFAGEWCTMRGLGTGSTPLRGVAYVGMTLFEEDNHVVGTGATSRPGSDTIFASRFRGDITAGEAVISVTDLDDESDITGPQFTLRLTGQGPRDIVGTMLGDPDFEGPITLVRLGPRCFVE